MDYSAFKAKAVVDWIEVEITTAAPTQHQWIQQDLRRILDLPDKANEIWVEPVNAGPGGVTCVFRIRLHDGPANSYAELDRIMAALAQAKPLVAQPQLHAIEIAVDFYAREQKGAPALIDLTKQLQASIIARGNLSSFGGARLTATWGPARLAGMSSPTSTASRSIRSNSKPRSPAASAATAVHRCGR